MLKYYKRFSILFIIGVIADIIVDYAQLYIPEYLGSIVEIISNKVDVQTGDITYIIKYAMIVAVVLFVGRIVMRLTILRASTTMEAHIRKDMFLKTERLSQRYFHETKAGAIMSSFTSDIEAIEEFVGWGTIMIVDAIFLSIMSLYKMIRLDIVLTMIVLFPMIALIFWGNIAEKGMSEKWLERQNKFDKLFDFTQENFNGIRVIKAFVKEAQEFIAFEKVAKENAKADVDFGMMHVKLDVSIEILIGFVISMILGIGGWLVFLNVNGSPFILFGHLVNLSAGKLVTFIGYVDTLIWPMIALGQILQMYSRFSASSKRILEYLDEPEEVKSKDNAEILNECKGKITFNNLSFKYPGYDNDSLSNISLEIKPGEIIGVVGKIGSGKTTLVNLLLRLYNVDKGSILIDDKDIMDLEIKSLRDNISYVPQDNFLFSDSVKNNIAFSDRKMTIDQIKAAAKFADVHSNIVDFNEGYDTVTGERGVTLSGGQKQRISIARAYAKNAPIMILDDSVSAVDVKTEEAIISNIEKHRSGKTTIIIASRISTVSKADKIIVLKDGKLEAFDTPSNLLKISPSYQKMSYLQQLESEL